MCAIETHKYWIDYGEVWALNIFEWSEYERYVFIFSLKLGGFFNRIIVFPLTLAYL